MGRPRATGRVHVNQRGSKFQIRVIHPDLPKDKFFTFDSETQARNYALNIERWFAEGKVPPELMTGDRQMRTPLVLEAIKMYEQHSDPPPTASDRELLHLVMSHTHGLRISDLTYQWAQDYVKGMKIGPKKLAPGTIRKRVNLLGRIMDHYLSTTTKNNEQRLGNVFRMLPRGYSIYADSERVDTSRDQRLVSLHEASILSALNGVKADDKERRWGNLPKDAPPDLAFKLLFELIVDTGLRLREAYKARCGDIDADHKFMNVRGAKGHRGKIKWRTVPLKAGIYAKLEAFVKDRDADELIFPYWSGEDDDLQRTSVRLSARFSTLFKYAKVPDFTEHDLRHEACCRWVMLKDKSGRWMFSEGEICRIMGWSDPKLLLRYLSLRGEDLSARLHQ